MNKPVLKSPPRAFKDSDIDLETTNEFIDRLKWKNPNINIQRVRQREGITEEFYRYKITGRAFDEMDFDDCVDKIISEYDFENNKLLAILEVTQRLFFDKETNRARYKWKLCYSIT